MESIRQPARHDDPVEAMKVGRTSSGISFKEWQDADGPWIALTHGAFLSGEDFRLTAETLSSRFKVFVWDLPGHGATALSLTPPRLSTASDALIEVMDHLNAASAIQIGFSFGGMVAQDFARRHPDRTRALIAYGCVPVFKTSAPMRSLLWAIMRLHFSLQPWPKFVESFARQASQHAHLQSSLATSMLAQPRRLRDAIWEAMLFSTSFEPDFQFSCPVGHIMGEYDDRFAGAYAAMKAFAASLPEDRRVDIPRAGHMAHLEAPEIFIEAISTLIDRLLQ